MEQHNALEAALGGPARTLTVAGRALTLTPLRVGELPAFITAVAPLLTALSAHAGRDTEALWSLAVHQPEALLNATCLAARVERAWLDERELDEAITLAAACVEVNADFFVHRLAPAIKTAGTRLIGLMSSPASPRPGTSPPP